MLNDYDAVTMRLFDNSFNVKNCVLDFSKSHKIEKESNFLKPVLNTASERPRNTNLLENLVAMIKRNFNVPDLSGTIDIDDVAGVVVEKFFSSYFHEEFTSSMLDGTLSQDLLMDWVSGQDASTVGQLGFFDYVDIPPVDSYKHMIKAQPKQKLDNSIQTEYPALQTIVYHDKKVNAIFGPIFKEMTRKLLAGLKENFLFYTRKTPEEIERFFSDLDVREKFKILELDISKYDKSQGEFHCAVEYAIWKKLGLDHFLEEVWRRSHVKTTLTDFKAGIRTSIMYQRKSGDVTTFIGNTIIVAACLASLLPMERCVKGAFCGDDSLLYFPPDVDTDDVQSKANLMWNFEAKLFIKNYGYFCGRYIIHHSSGVYVCYDPLKMISKLGAKNIKDYDHLEEFRVSLFDVGKCYGNCAYYGQLNSAIAENFPDAGDGSFCFSALYKYLSDRNLFKTLFVNGSD